MKSNFQVSKFVLLAAIGMSFLGGVWFAGSAADVLSAKQARDLLQHLAGANLSKDQVQIKKVEAGIGNGGAIVEAQIETAFRVKKEKDGWRIAEVRLGDRQWESFELIEEAIKREKARRTTALMMQLVDGLAAYQKERGQFATTDEIAELLDFLSPRYLSSAPRFDLWGKEFDYRGSSLSYRLSSAGPDGKKNTKDDLVVENGALKTPSE
ncbi:MAG: hypothetical protein SF097_18855 [Acidobacteriota bacterium]|nr:hypothetical protein [Acidobacteriota bacterium]